MMHRLVQWSVLIGFAGALLLAGCSSSQELAQNMDTRSTQASGSADDFDADIPVADNNDPIEGFNRAIFRFNEVVDNILLKPVTIVYRAIVPEIGRTGVHNFLTNLASPVSFANAVLQGDSEQAFITLWRFILNTTFGIGGLFDFADMHTDLKARNEDFGQTMGVYGMGSGPYLVLPILGPSSLRDFPGRVVDILSDPLTYTDDGIVITRTVVTGIDTRSENFDVIDEIYRTSFDPYATIRSAYLQKREAEVKNKNNPSRIKLK